MAVYTKINQKEINIINENFINGLKNKFSISIEEVEIIKEDVIFKVPKKLN